jgi:hypothetical protein
MTQWGDRVYEAILADLATHPLPDLALISPFTPPDRQKKTEAVAVALPQKAPDVILVAEPVVAPQNTPEGVAVALPVNEPEVMPVAAPEPCPFTPPVEKTVATAVEKSRKAALLVKAQLVFKSRPMATRDLLPYRESLVAFVYRVKKIYKGRYASEKIVVMHPAHIALKEQNLSKYKIGKTYRMQLNRLEETNWQAEKCQDETDEMELEPYIQRQDASRFPHSLR